MFANDDNSLTIEDNVVTRQCSLCGEDCHIDLDDDELRRFEDYLDGWGFIQELLPDLNKCEREFLKSGYCAECQKKLFGNGNTDRLY